MTIQKIKTEFFSGGMNRPRSFFFCYLAALVAALFWFQPGWGFMDDACNTEICQMIWSGQYSPMGFIIRDELLIGRFRPLYHVYVILIYWIRPPILIYYFTVLAGFFCLRLWGKILAEIYSLPKDDRFSVYVFPLLSFCFIPFWDNFMFISVQEKFLFFFSTFAIYQLIQAYRTERLKGIWLPLMWGMLGIGFKETGLALFFGFFVFAVADLVWFHLAPRLSRYLAAISGCFMIAYVAFIKNILGAYTASYKTNLSFDSLLNKLWHMPLWFNVLLAGLFFSCFLVRKQKPGYPQPFFLIIPAYILVFVFFLLPWHFYLYLTAPLGPFLMAWVFCFYLFVMRQNVRVAHALRLAIVALIILIFFIWIIPCLSKMGDKPRITDIVKDIAQERPRAKFFYPPPIGETAQSLRFFARANVISTNRINPADLKDCGEFCYLLTNDENGPVLLGHQVFAVRVLDVGTWKVRRLFMMSGKRGK